MGSPAVNPKFASFVCFDVKDKPWATSYDINGDGHFGVDDIKAFLPTPADLATDENEESLNLSCTQVKIGFVREEVEWKLKGLIAKSSAPSGTLSLFSEMDSLKAEALARIQTLDEGRKMAMAEKVRSAVIEMDLRARNVVKDENSGEPFGVGLYFAPHFISPTDWNLKIAGIYPFSSAISAGILPGDFLLAVDGRAVCTLSSDAGQTPDGLNDPETQLIRGLGGSKNSEVRLSLQRGDRKFDIVLKRNIWSGRHLGTPDHGAWDGQEHFLPSLFSKTATEANPSHLGCSFNPGRP